MFSAPTFTEAQLLQRLPPGSVEGSFPRDLIHPGEKVVVELRPGLFAGYGGRLIVFALLALFFGAILFSGGLWYNPFSYIFTGLPVLGIVVTMLVWRSTVYSLTDQRVLAIAGIRRSDLSSATLDRIVDVKTKSSGSGTLEFTLAPLAFGSSDPKGFGATPSSPPIMWGANLGALAPRAETKPGRLLWGNLGHPAEVLSFLDQAIPLYARKMWESARRQWIVSQLAADSVRCSYCGNQVDLMKVNLDAPVCDRCGAPLQLRGAE